MILAYSYYDDSITVLGDWSQMALDLGDNHAFPRVDEQPCGFGGRHDLKVDGLG